MKIIIDTKTNEVKIGSKNFNEVDESKRNEVENNVREFIRNNTKLTDYEEDCMWMSWRYCIGRHTIASHMHAFDIWKNCNGRMSKERELFNAFDINREIEMKLAFMKPYFHFPITSLNRIYSTAVDIVCQFLEDYNITSIEELLKYYNVDVELDNSERGYKLYPTTWEEYLKPKVHKVVSKYYKNDDMLEDFAWEYFKRWESGEEMYQEEMVNEFKKLTLDKPDPNNYYLNDFEDLFVWNDLVHCFDYEHHHKSILTNGEEVEWFWSWTNNSEKREDGYFYRSFGYHKIRVPIDSWNGTYTTYIPDENIKEDLY